MYYLQYAEFIVQRKLFVKSILRLKNVNEDDYGMYHCMARNALPATDNLAICLNITSTGIFVTLD